MRLLAAMSGGNIIGYPSAISWLANVASAVDNLAKRDKQSAAISSKMAFNAAQRQWPQIAA